MQAETGGAVLGSTEPEASSDLAVDLISSVANGAIISREARPAAMGCLPYSELTVPFVLCPTDL
jgi:hypothetical protein